MSDTDKRKQVLLDFLEKSLGVVTTATAAAGISRDTHYRWMREDKTYSKRVLDIENTAIDFVESKLFEQIKAGKPACIIFFLKNKGRKRGWCKKEIDV